MIHYFLVVLIILIGCQNAISAENLPFLDPCRKVWAHRGSHNIYPPNSIDACNDAHYKGAYGVEIDVYYDEVVDDFIVSHDIPEKINLSNYKRLEEIFTTDCAKGNFWIDLKGLDKIENIEVAVKNLRSIISKYGLFEKVFVESKYGFKLAKFKRAKIFTSFWISNTSNQKNIMKWIREIYTYIVIKMGRYDAISMSYKTYKSIDLRKLPNVPLFIFTVNRKKNLLEVIEDERVKIILTDKSWYLEKPNICK